VPYLSWLEGNFLRRHHLETECILGRDPMACAVALPQDASVSRRHAALVLLNGRWWIHDQGSRNGTLLNGLPLTAPLGAGLADGDELCLGDWKITFSERFPGLDGVNFVEGVGDLFAEGRPEPSQALVLMRGLELLHRSTEQLLQEGNANAMFRTILTESLKLLSSDRGFVVMIHSDGTWHCLHRVGDVEDQVGLSQSVLGYVLSHRTAVLSNAPMIDPRFGGASLVELHRGALMCAPMAFEDSVQGVLYLDRSREGRPFTRFDLAMLQAFVRLGTVALRHTQLAQKALGQAELQGGILRLKALHERTTTRTGEILGALGSSLRWLQSYGEQVQGDGLGPLFRHQVERLQFLVDSGVHETLLHEPQESRLITSLEALHGIVANTWKELARVRGAAFVLETVPEGTVWMAGTLATQALMGLVEPLLMNLKEGAVVKGQWLEDAGNWNLRLSFPGGPGPVPDAWTVHTLQETGILWQWGGDILTITFGKGIDVTPEPHQLPLLGLVTDEYELMGLFESVAEAGELAVYPLEIEPPQRPLPRFRYLVIDVKDQRHPATCIQAFRRHPSFVTVPILVVRAQEESFPALLAAGATDWLPDGFHWETLYHRLQTLRGHDELQRKARAVERLDSFRELAGTLKHEINNPLAVISMQVELLMRKYPEEPKLGKVEEMVERIRGLMSVLQKMRETPSEDYPGGERILKLR
jgi:hypothetical protein